MLTITDDIRDRVIKEYEAQKYREKCEVRVKTKPLGRAQLYFRLLIQKYGGGLTHGGWWQDTNELVKRKVCDKYGIRMITELNAEDYDEANEYAIELFTKETEDRGYQKDNVITWGLPWIRNRFGHMHKTAYTHSWEEWKKLCYDEVH